MRTHVFTALIGLAPVMVPALATAQEPASEPPATPAPATPTTADASATSATSAENAAAPATETATTDEVSSAETNPELWGLLCVQPIKKKDDEAAASEDESIQVRLDSNVPSDAKGGVRIPISARNKHRVRVYDGKTVLQSFTIDLSKYSRPNLRLQKKEGHDSWVIRQMRSERCPYPDMAMTSAAAVQ